MAENFRKNISRGTLTHLFIGLKYIYICLKQIFLETMIAIANQRLREFE